MSEFMDEAKQLAGEHSDDVDHGPRYGRAVCRARRPAGSSTARSKPATSRPRGSWARTTRATRAVISNVACRRGHRIPAGFRCPRLGSGPWAALQHGVLDRHGRPGRWPAWPIAEATRIFQEPGSRRASELLGRGEQGQLPGQRPTFTCRSSGWWATISSVPPGRTAAASRAVTSSPGSAAGA